MLGKLIKHDFKATSRLYIPIILGFIGMCIINKISFELGLQNNSDNQLVQIFAISFMGFYVLSAIALGFVTQIFIAMDFYKTMTGNQGYLTHTLPVKTGTLINSKLIVAIIWQIITSLLIILSIVLLLIGHVDLSEINEVLRVLQMFFEEYTPISISFFVGEIIAILILSVFYSPLMYYVSIAIGHLFQKHRLGASIIAYFSLYFSIQTISSVSGAIFGVFAASINNNMDLFWNSYNNLMVMTLIFTVILTVGFYGATWFVFNKKLNLD